MLNQKKAQLQEDRGFGSIMQIVLFILILATLAAAIYMFFKKYNFAP